MDNIIAYAKIDIALPQIDDVLLLLNNNWKPHYNTRDYEGGWDVLSLRSPSGDQDSIYAELNGHSHFADTPLMGNFPAIKQLVDTLQCPIHSVRLLNLKAGAIIHQHRDHELAFEKGEARLHFPIVTNERVEFFVNDTRVIMLPGQCWYINANLPHRVANHGNTDRIHLVIDCTVNDWLRAVFEASEKTTVAVPIDVVQTLGVIAQLRLHQTETSDKLADELELQLKTHNDD